MRTLTRTTLRLLALVALMLSVTLSAQAAGPTPAAGRVPTFRLPDRAVEVAPDVFFLGTARENGQVVYGYAYVHPAKPAAKPSPSASKCYTFLWKTKPKWAVAEPWVMNPSNGDGLSGAGLLAAMNGGIKAWEDAAQYNILGNGTETAAPLVADEDAPDLANEVYLADMGDTSTIAVTIIWRSLTQLVEWDQVYNTRFAWTLDATLEPAKMDFPNIATHELGHSAGLGDLYTSACSIQTMFGYASEGETIKRTLESGDITGINLLY